MIPVYYDGIQCFCLPDCACCKACHKRLADVDTCPEPRGNDDDECDPNCEHYAEIWDEKELNEELAKDEDRRLLNE